MSEVDRLNRQMARRSYATVYERTAWLHDIGEHEGSEYPYVHCPRCEMEHPLGLYVQTRVARDSYREALERISQLGADDTGDIGVSCHWHHEAAEIARAALEDATAVPA